MNTLISMSGIIGKKQDDVIKALNSYFKKQNKELTEAPLSMEIHKLFILNENNNNSVILYPKNFCELKEIALYLESEFKIPIFNFYIYDIDLWMYEMYYDGKVADKFKPLYDKLEGIDRDEVNLFKGNPKIICKHLKSKKLINIEVKEIQKYYKVWTEKLIKNNKKAYHNDEFPYGIRWQAVDFMKKLNLKYPIIDEEESIGRAFRLI